MRSSFFAVLAILCFSTAAQAGVVHDTLKSAPASVASWSIVDFPSSHTGWRSTGLQVSKGQSVTIFGEGQINGGLPLPLNPRHFIWGRIGPDGPVFNLATDQHTFTAESDGVLYLLAKGAGFFWEDRRGTLPPVDQLGPEVPFDARATAVIWRGDVLDNLRALSQDPLDPFGQAHAVMAEAPVLPDGFDYLWYLSNAQVFGAYQDDTRTGIRGTTHYDFGIVKKPVDIPLTDDSEISFEWRYDTLPAQGPETEAQFHDYLSIALEFDNGQDITWMWSPHLQEGMSFRCPLPWWDQRETHIVLQSGQDGLGAWHKHSRPVAEDYRRSVNVEVPKRITGVWFINSGIFSKTKGDARFANVVINSNGQATEIFDGN